MPKDKKKANKEVLPEKEEIYMAKPIEATPILKGQDLVDLVNDIKRTDRNKRRRTEALEALRKITRDK